jgi:hypothetical protein
MKKTVCLFIAVLSALSLFGCRATGTTRTRIANVPYSTTRTVRRAAAVTPRPATPRTDTRRGLSARRRSVTNPNAYAPGSGAYVTPGLGWPNTTDAQLYGGVTGAPRPARTLRPRAPRVTDDTLANNGGIINRYPAANAA